MVTFTSKRYQCIRQVDIKGEVRAASPIYTSNTNIRCNDSMAQPDIWPLD